MKNRYLHCPSNSSWVIMINLNKAKNMINVTRIHLAHTFAGNVLWFFMNPLNWIFMWKSVKRTARTIIQQPLLTLAKNLNFKETFHNKKSVEIDKSLTRHLSYITVSPMHNKFLYYISIPFRPHIHLSSDHSMSLRSLHSNYSAMKNSAKKNKNLSTFLWFCLRQLKCRQPLSTNTIFTTPISHVQ